SVDSLLLVCPSFSTFIVSYLSFLSVFAITYLLSFPTRRSSDIKDLTQETFQETIESNDIVLVDWWAEWCGPCKMFAPVYDDISQTHDDIVFGKIDTEEQQQLAAAAGMSSIPTLMAFRENVLVFSQPGAINAQQLEQLIEQVRELDMEDVHKQVEEARQKAEQDSN